MKKFVVIMFSISLIALFTSTKDVKVSTSSSDVAYSTEGPAYHPIQPPIG
ncbi:hypothetical protein SAMN05444673_5610 [Bacillus sp. OV166]|uniref:Phr family secreted Rap phosphatase inhibitor n=1 Tax=Priestia megaterium TaxID=1404 RepID=A0A6H1P9X3_PRIMG|nr:MULTISPECIES: hypothetical protein [Bacillaceae]QIZ10410.1 hypothetical protein HFZ78_29915 [Priestia megaterium]SMQ83871.1 hypothetical protein SAMN05444673_5610 [Bacillus sp. OV166]